MSKVVIIAHAVLAIGREPLSLLPGLESLFCFWLCKLLLYNVFYRNRIVYVLPKFISDLLISMP